MNKELLRKILYSVVSAINLIIPKRKQVFIYGGDLLNDNNEAIFSYLLNETNYTVICMADYHLKYKLRDNVKFVKNTYYNAIKYMLSSTVTFDCSYHTIKMKPTNKQLLVQNWHGSPLKLMRPSTGIINNGDYFSKFLYSAEIFRESMQVFYGVDDSKLFLNGNPRCDQLFKKRNSSSEIKIIWLPTYRKSKGRVQTKSDIPIVNSVNIIDLDNKLQKYNIHLYIKPHPMQSVSFEETIGKNKKNNIHLLSDMDLIQNNITLYEFLAETDALITDYSSVYFDYLLINKPIGFAIDDYDEYAENTGYTFENPFDYMPGRKILSYDALWDFIFSIYKGNDNYIEDRKRVNEIVNYYKDNNNSKRCVSLIKKFL